MPLFQRDPNLVMRKVADEILLIPIRSNVADLRCIYTLNEVGTVLWDHLDGTRDTEELVAVVLREFETDEATARADVQTFLADLSQDGLIRDVSPAE